METDLEARLMEDQGQGWSYAFLVARRVKLSVNAENWKENKSKKMVMECNIRKAVCYSFIRYIYFLFLDNEFVGSSQVGSLILEIRTMSPWDKTSSHRAHMVISTIFTLVLKNDNNYKFVKIGEVQMETNIDFTLVLKNVMHVWRSIWTWYLLDN